MRACTGYLGTVPLILHNLRLAAPPAWKLGLAVLGIAAIIFAGLFISQVERRHPIVHYRQRTFAVRPSAVMHMHLPVAGVSHGVYRM